MTVEEAISMLKGMNPNMNCANIKISAKGITFDERRLDIFVASFYGAALGSFGLLSFIFVLTKLTS